MRWSCLCLAFACFLAPVLAQEKGSPTDEKAQKTYHQGVAALAAHQTLQALDDFRKADKQDGGHCIACQKQMVKYGLGLGDWKTAELGAEEMVGEAHSEEEKATVHYQLGAVLFQEGMQKHKEQIFARAHEELTQALAARANFPEAIFTDGRVLAQLRQDNAAKAKFEEFVKMRPAEDPNRGRALRYIETPELARARMAPAFLISTMDGQRIAMDDLQGKVVLLDFWATWCGPCRGALPHIREIAKKFQGQPLMVISVSLDTNEASWKEFVAKNEMTWPQYFDSGRFTGPIATLFGVKAIPHTFTIDADGVLQDEQIGDASIEGKLKKLIARARELQEPGKRDSGSSTGRE